MADRGIWLPLWQNTLSKKRISSEMAEEKKNRLLKSNLSNLKRRKPATHGAEKRRKCDRLCDRRCNAKQCTVLWMGRQVLYEWKGSCDRSTSRSRYFSLTVNKRTQGISPLKQDQNATPKKNGRDVHESTPRARIVTTDTRGLQGGEGGGGFRACAWRLFLSVFFYEWGLWYVNECDWEKKWHLRLSRRRHCRNRHDVAFVLCVCFFKHVREKANMMCTMLFFFFFNRWLCPEIMADGS